MLASLIACASLSSQSFDDCLICISPNGLLIGFIPMEVIALDGNVCIAHKVLKQSTTMKKAVELSRADLHEISECGRSAMMDGTEQIDRPVYEANVTCAEPPLPVCTT